MNDKALEICKRNELWTLIKRVSTHYGGDNVDDLKMFAKKMLENCTLDEALACFRDLSLHCVLVAGK